MFIFSNAYKYLKDLEVHEVDKNETAPEKEQRLSERSRDQEVSKRVAAETADDIV